MKDQHGKPLFLHLQIEKVTILRMSTRGLDKITFEFVGPSPFPEMEAREPGKYPAEFSIEVRKGYAEEFLDKMGVDWRKAELIQVNSKRIPFLGKEK